MAAAPPPQRDPVPPRARLGGRACPRGGRDVAAARRPTRRPGAAAGQRNGGTLDAKACVVVMGGHPAGIPPVAEQRISFDTNLISFDINLISFDIT